MKLLKTQFIFLEDKCCRCLGSANRRSKLLTSRREEINFLRSFYYYLEDKSQQQSKTRKNTQKCVQTWAKKNKKHGKRYFDKITKQIRKNNEKLFVHRLNGFVLRAELISTLNCSKWIA